MGNGKLLKEFSCRETPLNNHMFELIITTYKVYEKALVIERLFKSQRNSSYDEKETKIVFDDGRFYYV